ncbi:bifunctional [glutamine synthetase] adenylyltransferase/[glutamine synthetase]-adenylyl-L-tyrosine phosphorylase [Specibacter cremeus]|uniref:bifunctional [glutamine synthetase] adenylyltransferase/[glutamine synthetase]-adenylyl-L-tyrosine phosphorylase n=1 Tax=Specibacter cremeus TaxID=1629051 RepID=UPI000F7B399D|nr:bifunctional [glutamine synthetase] adenylyltransferase/[glutamine synthetase]-adenylyl-L-tyrosine phosphorylase [Specibacter cremeus]
MSSITRTLIGNGFSDLEKSARFLAAGELEGLDRDALFAGLALANDPDMALQSLVWLIGAAPEVAQRLPRAGAAVDRRNDDDDGASPNEALFRLLGASQALAEFLVRNPGHLDVLDTPISAEPAAVTGAALRTSLLRAVGADPASDLPVAALTGTEAYTALRTQYRRHLTDLAIRDLCAASPLDVMPQVGAELADLAAAALDAALAVARAEAADTHGADAVARVRVGIVGMGKSGARELNYISDVDVMYLVDGGADEAEAITIGTALAAGISRAVNSPGREPALWEVDANLRPEGKDGPLVRTLDSYLAYYRRWAHSWEFQALLKARAMAGDLTLGAAFEESVAPLIWTSSERDGFVESVQAMRLRVTEHIPAAEAGRQLKLGKGGLRDVEFTVQLLQLVHAKADESLRPRATTAAITALMRAGYIGRTDAHALDESYRYLRVLEHRIQLRHLRRTHLMPVAEEELRSLACAVVGPLRLKRPGADALLEHWHRVKRRVRDLHENIFYRPILAQAAHLSADDVQLTPDAVQARLAALGYRDAVGATRHIQALIGGVSRRAALQRQLLPVLLDWLAQGVDPDAGLLGFRRVSEALGTSHWYLGMLRDHQAAAERLCHVLSSSRFITDLLEVSPEATAWLGNDKELVPLTFEAQWQEIQSKMSRHPDPADAIRLIRLIRRRETLRIAVANSSGLLDVDKVAAALSDADQAAILGALLVAEADVYGDSPPKTRVLVVAMGRQGGRENGYDSDADVLYVHRALPGADADEAQQQARAIVAKLSALLTQPLKPAIQAERVLVLDAALRPEGQQGPLVRSLEAYREYYARWSLPWETQALLRARPMAGADDLAADFMALVDAIRYPAGFGEADGREIRRIKARVESERLPRGADPARHVKLGRGGLSDVEWLVQLIQLQHAHEVPGLRSTSTIAALHAARDAGLVAFDDAEQLEDAWRLASRVRNANVIWTGRTSDTLPSSRADLEAVARWCGYEPGAASRFEEDYLGVTRRARAVFERVFYG